MNKFLIIAIALFTLLSTQVFGQSFHPPITNFSSKDYGKLRTPENWDITQDKRGVIYSAGGNGILEYDGSKWNFIAVKTGAFVVSLDSDESGRIYVGSQGDIGYLKADKTGDLKFISLNELIPEESRHYSTIWETICVDDKVYFQSEEFIFEYSDGTITVYESKFNFHTLFSTGGEIYSRQQHLGLTILRNGKFELVKDGKKLKEIGVFGMIEIDDHFLLITREAGLMTYSSNDGVHNLTTPDSLELVESAILGAKKLSNGQIAINSIESGVFIINSQGRILHRINKRKGIRVNDVKAIFEDRENNLWLALNNGISKVNYNSPLSYYSEESNLEGSALALIRHEGQLFVGTSSGLFVHNDNINSKNVFDHISDIHGQVWTFLEMNDELLVGTSDGVYKIYEIDGTWQVTLISELSANALIESNELGDLILAGRDGIWILTPGEEEPFPLLEESFGGITDIVRNPNANYCEEEFWIGTNSQGVVRIQIIDWEYNMSVYGIDDGLYENQWVRPILVEDSIFFGSVEGMMYFLDEHEMIAEGEDISDYNNLRGMFAPANLKGHDVNDPLSHSVTDQDRIWAVINDQILYLDGNNNFEFVNRPFWGINFGRVNKFYLEEDRTLWIGTADGLIRHRDNKSKNYALPFFSVIRRIAVGKDQAIYYGGFNQTVIDGIANQIKYENNSLVFRVAAPYFEDDHNVLFSYKLDGHDNEWSEWTENPEAVYTTLREGDYTFHVKAQNIYGQESEPTSYSFSVLPPWYRSMYAYFAYVFLGIIIIILSIRISSIRLKRKNERLEEIVAERTEEIAKKNVDLQAQKDEIQHQQQEIMDSINYAKRIQEAILPFEGEMRNDFPESFILFMPKDIVSGDFYWYAKVGDEHVIVCADCTGHGVPGAFMSMIGTDKLNHFVKTKQITDPSIILSEMNKGIKTSLKQSEDEESTRDGMDAAICSVNIKTRTLRFAGAYRPLWLIREGELTETRATKTAVAGHTADDQIYELHTIQLQEGDKCYMSSDGYADQFGGERGKKLKVKAMKNILLSSNDSSLVNQGTLLKDTIQEWMGNYEQIDDICVIGFKM